MTHAMWQFLHDYGLCVLCVMLALCPPKYDPAIRIKEWQIRQGWHPESKDDEL